MGSLDLATINPLLPQTPDRRLEQFLICELRPSVDNFQLLSMFLHNAYHLSNHEIYCTDNKHLKNIVLCNIIWNLPDYILCMFRTLSRY